MSSIYLLTIYVGNKFGDKSVFLKNTFVCFEDFVINKIILETTKYLVHAHQTSCLTHLKINQLLNSPYFKPPVTHLGCLNHPSLKPAAKPTLTLTSWQAHPSLNPHFTHLNVNQLSNFVASEVCCEMLYSVLLEPPGEHVPGSTANTLWVCHFGLV